MPAPNPALSRAALRQHLCERAAYETDEAVYRFLRAAIRELGRVVP